MGPPPDGPINNIMPHKLLKNHKYPANSTPENHWHCFLVRSEPLGSVTYKTDTKSVDDYRCVRKTCF